MVTAPWRRAFVCSLMVAPVVLLGSGCKTASGWRMPWSSWGGASSPSATALNISKPSTQAPSPTNIPGQSNRGIAANSGATAPGAGGVGAGGVGAGGVGTGGVGTAGVGPSTGVAGYPGTAQANAYPAQNVATWPQGTAAGGQVAPAGGLQVGPYGMQSNPPNGYAGNAQPRGPATGAAGYGGALQNNTAGATAAPGAAGTRDDYRTADLGAAGPYRGGAATGGAAAPAETPETNSVYGGNAGAATATEPSVYGSAEETSPAAGGNTPAAGPYGNTEPAESTAPRSYGPPNTVAPGARPSTSPPSSSGAGRPALPASLSGAGGYRPGSTAGGYGSRNAGYDQPQNAAVPESNPAGSSTYR
jgi:hypothetical protein